jgi:hypothetical protein
MIVCFKGRIKTFPLFLVVLFAFTIAACRKAEDTAGNDFVGDIVGFDENTIDTSTIVAYTSRADSIVNILSTNGSSSGMLYYYVGTLNDPDFGKTTAAPIFQYSMLNSNVIDLSTVRIDSIVLQIKYVSASSYYGNPNTIQQLNVYELGEALEVAKPYATNYKYNYNTNQPLGTWQGNFANMGDSVKLTYAGKNLTLPPHLRITLTDSAFIQKFRDAKANGALSSNTNFKQYFKGLIVKPVTNPVNPGDGCISYLQLRSGSDFSNLTTTVVVYYDSVQKIEFPIYNSDNIKAASIEQEHTVVIPIQPLLGGKHQNTNYVQALGGLKTRILIPNLFEYVKDKKIAITSARLVVPLAEGYESSKYPVPANLQLDDSDSLGVNDFSTDLLTTKDYNFYGGKYDAVNKQYVFNISYSMQYLFKQYKQNNLNYNYGFNLYVPVNNPSTASRAVIDTRPGKIKLKLSYTVIH